MRDQTAVSTVETRLYVQEDPVMRLYGLEYLYPLCHIEDIRLLCQMAETSVQQCCCQSARPQHSYPSNKPSLAPSSSPLSERTYSSPIHS